MYFSWMKNKSHTLSLISMSHMSKRNSVNSPNIRIAFLIYRKPYFYAHVVTEGKYDTVQRTIYQGKLCNTF